MALAVVLWVFMVRVLALLLRLVLVAVALAGQALTKMELAHLERVP
jgi:hypothetical protein